MKLVELLNTTPQTVAINGFVGLGTVDKNNVSYITVGSTGIQITSPGYYDITWTTDLVTTTTTQQIVFNVLADGIPITDAYAYGSTVGEINTVTTNKIIRVYCNSSTTLSIQNTGSAGVTVNRSNLSIVKIG